MKLSFATLGCPNWSLELIAANAAAMGFDGVELRGSPGEHIGPDEAPDQVQRIKRLFDAARVEISCIMGYTHFCAADPDKRRQSADSTAKFIRIASSLGCPAVRIFIGAFDDDIDAAIARAAGAIEPVAAQADAAGVKLAAETHDHWCRGANLRKLIDAVNSPALGICWDIANAFSVEPLADTHPLIAGHIAHVHFKDLVVTPEGKHQSTLVGQGEVALKDAMRLLHGGGYTGYVSLEWEKKWQPELAEPEEAFPQFMEYCTGLMAELGVPRG